MTLTRILIAAALLAPIPLHAQTPAASFVDSARTEIDAASAAKDSTRLSAAVILLDRALIAFPGDPYLLHYRGYAKYRQVITQYGRGAKAQDEPLIYKAIADLTAKSAKLAWAETYSLLATLWGLQIGIDANRAMTLGPQIMEYTARAVQMAPDNPRVLYLQAISVLNTPPEYGGGVEPSRALVTRALEAFKTDKPAPLAPRWGLAEATAFAKRFHAPAP